MAVAEKVQEGTIFDITKSVSGRVTKKHPLVGNPNFNIRVGDDIKLGELLHKDFKKKGYID